jgi:hypothetical protein
MLSPMANDGGFGPMSSRFGAVNLGGSTAGFGPRGDSPVVGRWRQLPYRVHPSSISPASALRGRGAAWAAESGVMPPQLTDYELETAARACRALAHVERESAEKISDPALRGPVKQRAQCAAALAEKFEAARKGPTRTVV